MNQLLQVQNLSIGFPTEDGLVQATRNLSFDLNGGETLAIVGESGSGKSVSSMAIMGLHNQSSAKIEGEIILREGPDNLNIVTASELKLQEIRGKKISMIFQDPMSALHPYFTIGNQIAEAWLVHNDGTKAQALAQTVEMLDLVGIPEAKARVNDYPHQFSGGMRQRVLIAMALINHPRILIADEPTTALDVTVQLQILSLLKNLQSEFDMSILLITHDMGIVAEVADRINVMYAGTLVESGTVEELFDNPIHPYTIGLLNSLPRVDESHGARLRTIIGQPPSLINLPSGCKFQPRCRLSEMVGENKCIAQEPMLERKQNNHIARCHLSFEKILETRVLG
jgi:peptide/nickel transport system ATP-binding protein